MSAASGSGGASASGASSGGSAMGGGKSSGGAGAKTPIPEQSGVGMTSAAGATVEVPESPGASRSAATAVTQDAPAAKSLQAMVKDYGKAMQAQVAANPRAKSVPPDINNLNEIMAALGGILPLEGYAEGGVAPAGDPALVGENGPEIIQSTGDTTVVPLTQMPGAAVPGPEDLRMPAKGEAPQRSFLQVLGRIAMGLGGQTGAAALMAQRAAETEQRRFLVNAAIQHPAILASSPVAAQAIDSVLGEGSALALLNEGSGESQARALARINNIPVVPAGTELSDGRTAPSVMSQVADEMRRRGAGMQVTSKGEIRFAMPARSAEAKDESEAWNRWQQVRDGKRTGKSDAEGVPMKGVMADVIAAQEVTRMLDARGVPVPKALRDLAMADTNTAVAASRSAVEEAQKAQVQLETAAALSQEREIGKRLGATGRPVSADEQRAADIQGVTNVTGGVAYGRDMKDDDLLAADEQGLALKQTTAGTYVGIPKDQLVPGDASYIDPREMLAKRMAQKMASNQTTQNQNAKTVIAALDDIDKQDALGLIPEGPELPAGASRGAKYASALGAAVRAQTVGRLDLAAARLVGDQKTRDKAVALSTLVTLATPFVKALGDVGAISEADKATFNKLIGSIANGSVGSRQEAALILQKVRTMMMHAAAGSLNKDLTHSILNSSEPNPNAPSPGYQSTGQGFQYRME